MLQRGRLVVSGVETATLICQQYMEMSTKKIIHNELQRGWNNTTKNTIHINVGAVWVLRHEDSEAIQ